MAAHNPHADHNPMLQEATLEQLAPRYAPNPRLPSRAQSAARQTPMENEVVMHATLGGEGQSGERAGLGLMAQGDRAAHVQREQQQRGRGLMRQEGRGM